MPISISNLNTQLSTLKGGSPYYYSELGPEQKISVKELGALTFPLNAIQVKALIEIAHVAPFGKGHETLVDRNVRNTWEIDAKELGLSSRSFQKALNNFLEDAAAEMNISGGIKAEPYKLLVYQEGGFFKEHQDSEKLPGMFGTLLVGLPSAHAGGQLLIDPGNGERVSVDFSEDNATNFPAVAFFADRKHEVEPVTQGYRVVLVFNLVQADGGQPTKIDEHAAVENMAAVLKGLSQTDKPFCLALDHQYTNTNFSTGRLKGNDTVRIAVLRKAAAVAGVNIRVGLIEEYMSASWENADQFGHGYDYGYRSRRSRYRYDDYSPKREPDSFTSVEVGEEYDGHLIMNNWLPEDGVSIGQLNLIKEDIATPPGRPEEDPIDWSVEGYQGNWGMTTAFTYRYAGVMLWHPSATGGIVEKMPLDDRLNWLMEQTQDTATTFNLAQSREVLTSIATTLQDSRYHSVDLERVTKLLLRLGKVNSEQSGAIFAPWRSVFSRDFEKVNPSFWPEAVKLFGLETIEGVFREVFENKEQLPYRSEAERPPVVMASIRALMTAKHRESVEIGQRCLDQLGEYLLRLPKSTRTKENYVKELLLLADEQSEHTLWTNSEQVALLLPSLQDADWIRETLAPTLLKEKLGKGSFLFTGLLEDLKERTANPPEPYTDLSRPLPKGMNKPEGDYQSVMDFLVDPLKDFFDFKAPNDDRVGLSNYIKRQQLDLAETTIRTRPSHTLRLTKTDASYQRRSKQYATDLKLYKQLVKLAESDNSPAGEEGKDYLAEASSFVRELSTTALKEGYSQKEVTAALRCYHGHFTDQVAGKPSATHTTPPKVDELLDKWEARLAERYELGTDDDAVAGTFPSLEALWAAAFGEVSKVKH